MPLLVPNLDDRRWADLVAEARSLIPRFAPRWTDHNVHDPGITLIELFAWLAEMQIYQLNRVGEKHREGFARLAGIRRRRRAPARVNLIASGTPSTGVVLPPETQVAPLGVEDVVFETTEPVPLTRSRLLQVVVDDATQPIDQTTANQAFGIAFLAFGEQAAIGNALRLGFDRFYPDEESELRIAADVFTADLASRCGPELPASPAPGESQPIPPVTLAWEYLGADNQWRRIDRVADGTASLSRSGAVTIGVPADAAPARERFWIRARMSRGAYDIEPRLRHIGVNAVPCRQIETVHDEFLGRGSGRPDQAFPLAKGSLLIPDSGAPVTIEVAAEPWTFVESFDVSAPAGKEYAFDPDGARVLFGNGLNGRVPPAGAEVRATKYQRTAGRSGKVAAGLSWRFLNRVVTGVSLTNPDAATGGVDDEPLHDMELRARASLAPPQRAVTLEDIERLVLATPDAYVARAHAIADCPTPATITVVAVPKVRPGRTGPPRPPSDAFLGSVRRHLQPRRLLCDNLRVVGPVYVEVSVSARLRLVKGAGPAAVLARARAALDRFLSGEDPETPAERGGAAQASPSPCPTRWPFARPVFPSEVYAVLHRVPGVDAVSDVVLTARRGAAPLSAAATGAIRIPRIGLAFPGPHELRLDAGAAA